MPHHLRLVILALMAFYEVPVVGASEPGTAVPADPPEDMIDFLGRRQQCTVIAPEPGDVRPPPPPGSWEEWLRCAALAAEEVALRRRYAGNASATAFLDQAPGDFQLDRIVIDSYHGPELGRVEQLEQRGFDAGGRTSWRMALDRQAAQGRVTSISISWGMHPTRTIYLDNARLPHLDLTSAWVALEPQGAHERLLLVMRYGSTRGWCGHPDRDDRARVTVTFRPQDVRAVRQDLTNCNSSYDELDISPVAQPPR